MAGLKVGASARASLVTDTPSTAAGVAGGYLGGRGGTWFDPSTASFWTLAWAVAFVVIIALVFHGLLR